MDWTGIVIPLGSALLAAGGAVWAAGRRAGEATQQIAALGDRLGDQIRTVDEKLTALGRVTETRLNDHSGRVRDLELVSARQGERLERHDGDCPARRANGGAPR